MWDALLGIGLPLQYIDALKLFDKSSRHFIKIGGSYYKSVEVYSGVRQGCPLSPILFALCADILLREIAQALAAEDCVRAFADDTAVVISDYVVAVPVLGRLFEEFRRISALSLNTSETIFIPLWKVASPQSLQTLIRELCPYWRDISVKTSGKYLCFCFGPGSGDSSWEKPLQK